MGDIAVGGRPVATPRAWGDYPMVREDAEVSIASRPRTRAMTAEQEKWVHDLTTHPVLSQASTEGLSTPREPREPASNLLANPSQGDFSCQGGSLMDGASRASTVPMTNSPVPGSGRGESGDGYGSDLLRGNYLRERAIRGSVSQPGLIGPPNSAQQAREQVSAEFHELSEARAAREQVLEARAQETARAIEEAARASERDAHEREEAVRARERDVHEREIQETRNQRGNTWERAGLGYGQGSHRPMGGLSP